MRVPSPSSPPGGTADPCAQRDAYSDLDWALSLGAVPPLPVVRLRPGATPVACAATPLLGAAVIVAFLGWVPLLLGVNMRSPDPWMAGWNLPGIAVLVSAFTLFRIRVKRGLARQGVCFSGQD